jgi:hypothetical protein
MKSKYLFIVVLWLNVLTVKAQQNGGIYYTESAFRTQQISIPANCQLGKKAIQVSDFFLRPYVYIQTGQGKIKIHQDSIYAIQNCDGNIYRIWKQKAYLLSDNGKLKIYSYNYAETVKKRTLRSIRYERKPRTDYFFSVNDTSAIVPLTLTNVRLALLSNSRFDKEIELAFPDDASLKTMQGNQFRINQFISEKTNNN